MYDITNYVNLSPLKNETFKFQSTTYDDARMPTYTTTAIRSWMYGMVEHQCPNNNGHILHEVAHSIDMFRKNKNRLLKDNFGFVRKKEKWPLNNLLCETKVIAIQLRLADMDKKFFKVSDIWNFYNSIDNDGNYAGLPLTLIEFTNIINNQYNKETVYDLLTEWYAVCDFVKNNRN